jgi:methionine aminopeptidase
VLEVGGALAVHGDGGPAVLEDLHLGSATVDHRLDGQHQARMEPQVPNYGKPKRREKLVPGLTIAIEPMVNIGGPATKTLSDRWTIVTLDGSLSAHFEHTVAITDSGTRVLTRLDDVAPAAAA